MRAIRGSRSAQSGSGVRPVQIVDERNPIVHVAEYEARPGPPAAVA